MPFLLVEQRTGGWSVDLLCSRNARPEKALVGSAQWEAKQATLTQEDRVTVDDPAINDSQVASFTHPAVMDMSVIVSLPKMSMTLTAMM